MRAYLDCFPCFLQQALRAARIATRDEEKIKRVLDAVGSLLKDIPLDSTPPLTGRLIYQKVSEITGNPDPYREIKKKSTERALALYPCLKSRVAASSDRLLMAIRMAIAGNVIDFGANWDFDLNADIDDILEKDFAIGDYDAFKDRLAAARDIVYLGDNAGECVFDRILIEELGRPVTYAVRDAPIINDATKEDAMQAGIADVATLVSSGTDAPGTILETCRADFLQTYRRADLVISKGQGNYEALSPADGPVFFMLKVKCPVIGDHLGVAEGGIVLQAAEGL